MEDIIKIVKSLEDSGLLLKGVSETIQNEAKKEKGGFLSMLLGTLGASLLGNILAWKGSIAKRQGRGVIKVGDGAMVKTKTRSKKQGKGIISAGHGNKTDF